MSNKKRNKREKINIDEYKKNALYTKPFQEASQYQKEYVATQKQGKKIKKDKIKNKNKKKKILKRIFLIIFVLILLGVSALGTIIVGALKDGEKLSAEDFKISTSNSYLYAKNGEEIAVINNGTNRMVVDLNEMSEYLPKAFISIEDERFYSHKGVDIKRTAAAVFTYITNGGSSSFGGSTITQQLVKNITEDNETNYKRKIREMVRALQVESWLSKDEILELYLNVIYLGDGAYGVQTASYTYFDKDVSELTIAECAMIAGITQSPEYYNPHYYPERAKERQEVVLWQMKDLGYITEEQYNEAVAQELVYKRGQAVSSTVLSYFVEAAIEQVTEDLQEQKGISEAMAKKMIYSNGLKIYTTLDQDVQDIVDSVYTDMSYFKKKKDVKTGEEVYSQSAITIMDYKTGEVVALYGGSGEKTINLGLNRATDSYRQPGSCIKPLAVYSAGIESRAITAGTVFSDEYLKIGDWPVNEWFGAGGGTVTTRRAVAYSMNRPAVLALQKTGIDYAYNFLENLGITSLQEKDKNLSSLALRRLN